MAPSGWAARDADARARARGRIEFGEVPTGGPARRDERSGRREILCHVIRLSWRGTRGYVLIMAMLMPS